MGSDAGSRAGEIGGMSRMVITKRCSGDQTAASRRGQTVRTVGAEWALLNSGRLQCERPGMEGADRKGVQRRNHVGDQFRHHHRAPADPKGDRAKIGLLGKFLPFKYYGATGNQQAYGYKQEVTTMGLASAK